MSSSRPTLPEPEKQGRIKQFAETYRMASKSDPQLGLWIAGSFVVGALVGFGVFWLAAGHRSTLGMILTVVGAVMLGVLAALITFSRRAQKAAYAQMEGQVGAAAGALQLLKRGWRLDTAIAFNKQQDVVHRVIGPPGVVLVGEGNAGRVKGLLTSERRRHERVISEVPVHEVICGNGEGQVPLPKIARHIQKMKRQVKPAEITDVLARLKAIDASRPVVPMPKGPVPTSMKGMRGNFRGR
jgi:F0F1-type ATP synthase assembly protein I